MFLVLRFFLNTINMFTRFRFQKRFSNICKFEKVIFKSPRFLFLRPFSCVRNTFNQFFNWVSFVCLYFFPGVYFIHFESFIHFFFIWNLGFNNWPESLFLIILKIIEDELLPGFKLIQKNDQLICAVQCIGQILGDVVKRVKITYVIFQQPWLVNFIVFRKMKSLFVKFSIKKARKLLENLLFLSFSICFFMYS